MLGLTGVSSSDSSARLPLPLPLARSGVTACESMGSGSGFGSIGSVLMATQGRLGRDLGLELGSGLTRDRFPVDVGSSEGRPRFGWSLLASDGS